jgi:D-3-phosphoglycerate dehydrogenase
VAELVLAQAILLLRGIPEKNASCHRGGWIKSAANSFEIRGKKLGIVGYGSIGTQLSVLAEGLGMQVFFYDTVTKLPLGNATQVNNLHELLGMSDIVTRPGNRRHSVDDRREGNPRHQKGRHPDQRRARYRG